MSSLVEGSMMFETLDSLFYFTACLLTPTAEATTLSLRSSISYASMETSYERHSFFDITTLYSFLFRYVCTYLGMLAVCHIRINKTQTNLCLVVAS